VREEDRKIQYLWIGKDGNLYRVYRKNKNHPVPEFKETKRNLFKPEDIIFLGQKRLM